MLMDYKYDGSTKFNITKVSTDETSLESDREKAEIRK